MIDSSHDSKQFKQLQLTFDGKLSKPGFTNKVFTFLKFFYIKYDIIFAS